MKRPFPLQKKKDISFQVVVYFCKVAANGLFSSTFLFIQGSAEVYFLFSKLGILCLQCALPTSLGHWWPWFRSLSRVTQERGKPSFYLVLPCTHQVSCWAPGWSPWLIIWPWYSRICLSIMGSKQQGCIVNRHNYKGKRYPFPSLSWWEFIEINTNIFEGSRSVIFSFLLK